MCADPRLKVFDAMDEGLISPRTVADMCLLYMSMDDIADMLRVNDCLELTYPQ